MVKKIAPDHIKDFCDSFSNGDKIFEEIKNKYEGDFSFVYRVVCSCKNSLFWIYKDEHPTIVLECSKCKKRITAYDLKNYPLAIKLNENYALKLVFINSCPVYVNYEYSDEYLYNDDVSFDNNDITWCRVMAYNEGHIQIILDDETI